MKRLDFSLYFLWHITSLPRPRHTVMEHLGVVVMRLLRLQRSTQLMWPLSSHSWINTIHYVYIWNSWILSWLLFFFKAVYPSYRVPGVNRSWDKQLWRWMGGFCGTFGLELEKCGLGGTRGDFVFTCRLCIFKTEYFVPTAKHLLYYNQGAPWSEPRANLIPHLNLKGGGLCPLFFTIKALYTFLSAGTQIQFFVQ